MLQGDLEGRAPSWPDMALLVGDYEQNTTDAAAASMN